MPVVTHFPLCVRGITYLIVFLGYLFNKVQGENSLASHVEEIGVLELGFSKEYVISREKHVRRSLTNVSFLCLLDLV
jgi:hypothetical protein